MADIHEIELKEATIEDIPLLESYLLEDDQYTAMPIDAMTESLHETQKYPILIIKEESLVGFFILQKDKLIKNYPLSKETLFLQNHSIDQRFQKKGYGKLSMELLPAFIQEHFEEINEVVLTVDHDNLSGQMLYLKSGFKDTKKRIKEKDTYKFIYAKKLNSTT